VIPSIGSNITSSSPKAKLLVLKPWTNSESDEKNPEEAFSSIHEYKSFHEKQFFAE
jgi:hypothetical protein